MGPKVTADSGRFCRLICIELSCVLSWTLAINFHYNKSYTWRISMTWHHKYLADIHQFLPHAGAYAIFHSRSSGIHVGDMNATR